MAVSTSAIIEHLDVIVDLRIGDISSLIDSLLDPLLLHAAKKMIQPRRYPSSFPADSYWAHDDVHGRSAATHHCHITSPDLNESVRAVACVAAREK